MKPAVALTAAFLTLASLSLAFGFRDAPSQARDGLSWRQTEILHVRARTHACTDALGRPRFRVQDRIVRGGPAYRAWVLSLWRKRAVFYCSALERRRAEPDWRTIQIFYATLIAKSASVDPWPNCPDPYFDGASWTDTVACENNGSWLDSPGYYRCGLQFDPMWERHYGRRFCP